MVLPLGNLPGHQVHKAALWLMLATETTTLQDALDVVSAFDL